MDDLYVTSAATETTDLAKQHPHSGHLFVAKGVGYKGKERTRFRGTFQR
jgi:sugar lactone lactonase YvrE